MRPTGMQITYRATEIDTAGNTAYFIWATVQFTERSTQANSIYHNNQSCVMRIYTTPEYDRAVRSCDFTYDRPMRSTLCGQNSWQNAMVRAYHSYPGLADAHERFCRAGNAINLIFNLHENTDGSFYYELSHESERASARYNITLNQNVRETFREFPETPADHLGAPAA